MTKQCEYCDETFNASRKDTKYCCNSCKQSAYIARNFQDKIIESNDFNVNNQNGVLQKRQSNPSRRVKNVNDSITLSRSEFSRLINSNSAKAPLEHLLSEKDFGRDILSQNSELRMELRFTVKELEELKEKYDKIKKENEELNEYIDGNEQSVSEKFMGLFMEHADTAMPAISGLASALAIKITGKKPLVSGTPLSAKSEEDDKDFSNLGLDSIQELSSHLNEITNLYPDISLDNNLGKIVELMKTNKALADSILYS